MQAARLAILAPVLAILVASIVSGQPQQRPATQDDLLTEMRLLRADVNRAAQNTVRAHLAAARLTLQEARVSTLVQRRDSIHQQIVEGRLTLAPFTLQLKQAQDTNSEILAPLRTTMDLVLKREHELQAQDAEIDRLLATEQDRWMNLSSRLDEIERELSAAPAR
jgi:hypothetical protein